MTLQEVQNDALHALSLIRDEVLSLFKRNAPEPNDITQTLWMLFKYQSERSIAVSFLLSHGYAWDSEIILRSFYETTAKILFICFSDADKRNGLVEEFWHALGQINHRKTSRKTEISRRFSKERANKFDEAIFSVFQNENLFPKDGLNKEERRKLEHKWSFSEIIEALGKMHLRDASLSDIKVIFHMYGMASHLTHADCVALDLMADRQFRENDERQLLEGAHACRIMTDQVSLGFFSAEALRTFFDAKFEDRTKLISSVANVFSKSKEISGAFNKSQREFYRSYGADL